MLTLIKQSSSQYAIVGDVINYTITASNNGTIPITNISVNDLLPPELEFVSGSVRIDSDPKPEESMLLGVNIGSLMASETRTVSFDSKVLSVGNGIIPNLAKADYYSPQLSSVNSNTFNINVYNASLSITKTSDVSSVNINDYITYTVVIRNTGNLPATNVIFKDSLSNAVTLVHGSFSINGSVVNNVDLSKGINVGNISPGGYITIIYKVNVLGTTCNGNIINLATATFNYELQSGISGTKQAEIDSNSSVSIKVSPSTFRQINLDDYLQIPAMKPDIETINNVNGRIEILNSHVIQTQSGKSSEGLQLSGYKLIIHGVLREVIEYTADESTQSVHSSHYNIPFSNFIILPVNYKLGSKLEVEGIIEGISTSIVDSRCFYNNATILLSAKVLSC